jgi:uncharacterized membrane protein
MWRLVREGLRFYRRVLLASWAFGVGIFVLVLVIIRLVGSVHDLNAMARAGVQLPLAILIASMIAGFIALGTERSENRLRLHAMLPLPIGQVAVARVLLPAALMLLGLVAAHVLLAVLLALEGSPALSPRHVSVDYIGVQLLFWLQLPLVIPEINELRRRTSWTAALAAKGVGVLAVALMGVVQFGPLESVALRAAAATALAVFLMAFTVALFLRRKSFTK